MYLTHLRLADFRSYALAEIPLTPGVTVFVGPNGVGKTNIVEGIGYLSTQDSHRVAHDAPLVRFGAQQALVAARLRRGSQDVSVELNLTPGRANRARINRSQPVRARDALGLVRSVLFSPEDLELVNGDPGARRRFVDDLVVQLRPDQAAVRADYERVLKQRNALLKSARGAGRLSDSHLATLQVWDMHLAAAGARVLRNRVHVLGLLAPHLAAAYASLTDGSKAASAVYACTAIDAVPSPAGQGTQAQDAHGQGADGDAASEGLPSESAPSKGAGGPAVADPRLVGAGLEELEQLLLSALEASRTREVERGLTVVGPHRDEIELGLGPAPAKGFASHGETWSLALALRLASYAVLTEDDPSEAARPVLLLDDVFAELDARRRSALVSTVQQAEQVLVTAAVLEDVPQELEATIVPVGPGWVGQEPERQPEHAQEGMEGESEAVAESPEHSQEGMNDV